MAQRLLLLLGVVPVLSSPLSSCPLTADLLCCSGRGLQWVPTQMPASTVTLDLSHNLIGQLQADSFLGLTRLETLRMAHNRVGGVQQGAFRNCSGALLRHLDLSSNQLRALEQHFFVELTGLEELLLFDNHMVQVEGGALGGLVHLRRLYLSHNHLTDFPFFSLSHAYLVLLDLSSNRLPRLPLWDVLALPPSLQQGLYLHANPLLCDCSVLCLFRHWQQLGHAPVTLLKSEHVCLDLGVQRHIIHFLLHPRLLQRCEAMEEEGRGLSVTVREGASLLLHCSAPLPGMSFLWVAPSSEWVVPPGNGDSLRMFANGSLEIVAAGEHDSGTYQCVVFNYTWQVNVTVLQTEGHAPLALNTGVTTLLGCAVSLLLVLLYLYTTPCPRAKPTPTPAVNGTASILIQAPLTTAEEGPKIKVSTNKHVVFMEPIREQNGRPGAGLRLCLLFLSHTLTHAHTLCVTDP
uniref:Adhesion molecule with Ig-like domain 3 n=1 Tax=Gouania willdenowi TaxID=441366 RepID=A0A8C5DJY5_GOUWI